MTDREMFMYELWKTAMINRKDGHGKMDYSRVWEYAKVFWIPLLNHIADRVGY